MTESSRLDVRWGLPKWVWVSLALLMLLFGYVYYFGIEKLLHNWLNRDEYSHGLFVPFLSLFLVWQKKDILCYIPSQRSWGGVALTAIGIALYFLGEISAITALTQLSLVVVLAGITLSLFGWEYFRHIWAAFFFLFLTIPLPQVIYQDISRLSQLVSSELGVAIIRLFDISVHLEGNVIDLGTMKLQVVEACSGLRYLFPLMSLAFICAYFYRGKMWKRVLIFVSSVPIAIFVNSLRIGMIGVTVEYWGAAAAEGFLHDFEGWVMFMACMTLLIGEMWLLTKIGSEKKPLGEVFSIDMPEKTGESGAVKIRNVPNTYAVSIFLLCAMAVFSHFLEARVGTKLDRQSFVYFPEKLDQWAGQTQVMESIVAEQLDFEDYILSSYTDEDGAEVNLYIAYYGEQRKGASIHSPRACLPGGGWEIASLEDYPVEGVEIGGHPLVVNRTVIKKDEYAQLVYYWFKQRERNETSEFSIKWWLFWDALTRNRTDGALIRLTTLVFPNESMADADKRLTDFTNSVYPHLADYIPD